MAHTVFSLQNELALSNWLHTTAQVAVLGLRQLANSKLPDHMSMLMLQQPGSAATAPAAAGAAAAAAIAATRDPPTRCSPRARHWSHWRLQPEAAATHDVGVAAEHEHDLQSMVSALRVALSKKEAALVCVAGQLAEAQGRLQQCRASNLQLEEAGQELRQRLQAGIGGGAPGRLPAACSITPDGRLLAQARQDLALQVAHAGELAAERDAALLDVARLQRELVAAAQAETAERERLCAETAESRLLARARARQVDILQTQLQDADKACCSASSTAAKELQAAVSEAEGAKKEAAAASARAAAAEATAARLRQEVSEAKDAASEAQRR